MLFFFFTTQIALVILIMLWCESAVRIEKLERDLSIIKQELEQKIVKDE